MDPLEKLKKINQETSQRCSSALSKLTQKQIEVGFFESLVTDLNKIPPFVISPKEGVGIFLPIAGIPGNSLIFFPEDDAFTLCDIMMKRKIGTTRELSEFDQGIMKEIANILLGNYLAIFSNALKIEAIAGMPRFSSGMFSALWKEAIANFAKDNPQLLVVKIGFDILPTKIAGYLILLFKFRGGGMNLLQDFFETLRR